MADNRYYGVRVEGAKYGVGFGSALAIAISYTANHSILWAIIHGILGWLYVIYFRCCSGHEPCVQSVMPGQAGHDGLRVAAPLKTSQNIPAAPSPIPRPETARSRRS